MRSLIRGIIEVDAALEAVAGARAPIAAAVEMASKLAPPDPSWSGVRAVYRVGRRARRLPPTRWRAGRWPSFNNPAPTPSDRKLWIAFAPRVRRARSVVTRGRGARSFEVRGSR